MWWYSIYMELENFLHEISTYKKGDRIIQNVNYKII